MMDFYESYPVSLHLSGLELIDEKKSSNYQKIQLLKHKDLGKLLVLDGEIQHIEVWAPLYHETLVHLPTAFIKKLEHVLILGGGCFFTAKEVLKYNTVKEVTMIDYDQEVVQMIERNYIHAKNILKDNRFNLIINDAFQEIKKLSNQYDLIINDAVDLINYHEVDKNNIFNYLADLTKENGICVDMIYRHIFEKETTQKTIELLRKNGSSTAYSLMTVPEYPGILHLLVMWGKNKNVSQNLLSPDNVQQRQWILNPIENPCEFYNPGCLNYYLYLPPYLKRVTNESSHI